MSIELIAGTFDGLIFDCDGTLVDTAPAHYKAVQYALQRHAMSMPAPWYFARTGLSPDAMLTAFEADFQPLAESREDFGAAYRKAFQTSMDAMEEVAVVADVARTWKGRVPMAVASNGQKENVRGTLRAVGLLDLFEDVVAIEDVKQGKPAPDVYLEAARRIGIVPERCIVLEDTEEGLAAGRAAGARVIDIRACWTPSWKNG